MMSRPLPNGWSWIPLGQYVENHDGRRVPISRSERASRQGAFPYYGSSGAIDTIDGFTHDGEFILIGEDGANLLTRSKPLAFLTKGKVWVNNHAHVLRCKPGFSNAYLAYYINSINLSAYVTGTAQPKLSQSMMNKIPIPVAPPAQQIEIVAELDKQFSRLDEAVANLQRAKANLKRYKASVLKAAVEGRLVETEATLARREARTYETGEQLLQRILEERRAKWSGKGKYAEPESTNVPNLSELPEGWIWASAVQAFERVVDCHNKTAPYTSTGIPLIRPTNIKDGRLLLDDTRYVDQPTYEFWSRRCPPEPGDVLFTREAPMGEAGIIPPGVKLCLGQRTMLMRPSPAISSSFLLSALLSPVVKDLIDRVAVGSGVKHLRVGDVERLPVPLPPAAEQTRIVAEVDRHLSIIREVEAEVDANLQRAQALRQATLAKAFHTA
jgi:type I restriction enzyme S subunit